MDHALRRGRLAERLPDLGVEALLVTRLPNVRYLTGFTGSRGEALVAPGEAVFFTDGRYEEQSRHEVLDLERVATMEDLRDRVVHTATRLGVSRLGFEEGDLTYKAWGELRGKAEGIELVPVGEEVERLRRGKDPEEMATIRRAQEATDVAFEEILSRIREGVTERELALELELAMRRAGADAPAFESIVAFGEGAAEPHHAPDERPLRAGDVVKLDFGALVDGYHADMTRTVALGEPPAALREVYQVVQAAQAAGAEAVRAGAATHDVDRAARSLIEDAGYGDRFTHGLGHGVGLEVHEGPWLRPKGEDLLVACAVVTVEPGVYIPGLGGVRIEDMVEVTEDGCRVIPRSSKELLVL